MEVLLSIREIKLHHEMALSRKETLAVNEARPRTVEGMEVKHERQKAETFILLQVHV